MISLILHFKNECGEAVSVLNHVTCQEDDNGGREECFQEGGKLVVRKTWNRAVYFPNILDEIGFYGEEQLQLLTGIMIEADSHFPAEVWSDEPEPRQLELNIFQYVNYRKASLSVVIEDPNKLDDIVQELGNIADGFFIAVAVQNKVWQALKIIASDDPEGIKGVAKKLRQIQHIVTREVNPTYWFEEEKRKGREKEG